MDKILEILWHFPQKAMDTLKESAHAYLEPVAEWHHGYLTIWWWEYIIAPEFTGVVLLLIFFLILGFCYKRFRNSGFIMFFEMIFEKIYEFFEDILGVEEKRWTKVYITAMFFIILLSNLFGVFLEILAPMFGQNLHFLEHYVKIPTANINFNVAMAVVWVIIVIYEQFKFLGFGKAIYEYFPILGKNYIPYERGNLPSYIDWPLFLLVKIFDILISLFLGVLEIVGHLAKIISLSFRLFWNVTSGGLLLGMLVAWVLSFTGFMENITGMSGDGFTGLFLLPIYFQELLVACIQALVFPLLIAIFIKVAKVH